MLGFTWVQIHIMCFVQLLGKPWISDKIRLPLFLRIHAAVAFTT